MIQKLSNTLSASEMKFLMENHIKFVPCYTDESVLSSRRTKIFLEKYNQTIILNKFSFYQEYKLKDFINDLKQYQNVELHENILKFKGIFRYSVDEVIFFYEFASDGTLRQYLHLKFKMINWNDKLRLAKQITSAMKYLHENDIVHANLV
ncbi:9556_t:CDS:2, partial [Cetraspora pellucida]